VLDDDGPLLQFHLSEDKVFDCCESRQIINEINEIYRAQTSQVQQMRQILESDWLNFSSPYTLRISFVCFIIYCVLCFYCFLYVSI